MSTTQIPSSILSLADKDPFPAYEALQKKGPVVWDSGMNCWLVLSYDLCKSIATDEGTYRIVAADAPDILFEIRGGKTSVGTLHGEEHARMRRLYLKLLGPSAMPNIRDEHVVPVINDTIDRFADKGSAELVHQFSEVVTPRIMASLFGLPWKDDVLIDNLARWHKDIVTWVGLGYPDDEGNEVTRKAKLASDELNDIYRPLVIERRDKPGTDFISQIWAQAPEYYGPLGVDQVTSIVRSTELAAGETTTNALANVLYLFLSEASLREEILRDQETALNAFVEETLRFLGSVQWRFRVANRDVSLGDVLIKKDDRICLLNSAANRDQDHYACPHLLDLHRKSPADHLAFGVGQRVCLGMWLARLELRESLKAFISRLPDMRLDPAKEAPHFRAFSHRSFGPLHVLFEPESSTNPAV